MALAARSQVATARVSGHWPLAKFRGVAFLALAVLLLAALGCGAPAPPPTPVPPTAAPTPTFRPAVPPTAGPPTPRPAATASTGSPGSGAVNAVTPDAGTRDAGTANAATPDADASDVEAAFLSNVDDLIAEATDLSVTPCEDLVRVTRDNPNLVSSIRGFAATLKRASASQPLLDTDAVKAAIADLDQTMGQLDGALGLCGIPTSGQP